MIAQLLLPILALSAEPERVCVREQVTKREVCNEDKHPILGAGIGWLVLGPLGAVVGSIAGSNPNKDCRIIEESVCIEYEIKKKK